MVNGVMLDGTYSVSQAAELVGVSKNTVRLYSKDFKQFLSDSATPESGKERRFNDDDIKVMVTVRTLRTQKAPKEAIFQALLEGDRFEPGEPVEKSAEPPEPSEVTDLATTDLLERFVVRYEIRIDELEGKLDTAEEGWRGAEIRAATAEARLDGVYRRHWYQFWKPDKPEDD